MTTYNWDLNTLDNVSYSNSTHLNLTDLCFSVSTAGIEERIETSAEVNLITENLGEINQSVIQSSENPNLSPEIIFSNDGTVSVRNLSGEIETLLLAWNETITQEPNINITLLKNDIGISILSQGYTQFLKKEFHFRVPIVINNNKILKSYYIPQNSLNLPLDNAMIDLLKINNNLNQNLTISNKTQIKTKDGTLYKINPTETTDIRLYYRTIIN